MGEYLIDSNVISNYFSAYFPEKGMNLVSDIIDNVPDISVIKTPDAIIAATAIVNNLTLVTSYNDFQNIEGLKVIDPHFL